MCVLGWICTVYVTHFLQGVQNDQSTYEQDKNMNDLTKSLFVYEPPRKHILMSNFVLSHFCSLHRPVHCKRQLIGPVQIIHKAKARADCKSGKNELTLKQGESIDIIRIGDNPEGRWLARSQDGSSECLIITDGKGSILD